MTPLATGTVDRLRGADFLDIAELDRPELEATLDLAAQIKAGGWRGSPLDGRTLALLFQKPSMRTRVSFQVGVSRLGGSTVTLGNEEVGLGQRESVADAARVLDRYVDGIVARVSSHEVLLQLAAASERPVINALSDASHPCQVLADVMTMRECLGRLDGSTRVAFVGDGNNVANSLMEASVLLGFPLTVISPAAYRPKPERLERAPGVSVTTDLRAAAGSSVIYTDVWTSMGQEAEREDRRADFAEYQVDAQLMELAPDAFFMHCLPAHRGEEVTSDVIDGPQSVVLDQAGNRLYAQMALLALIYREA